MRDPHIVALHYRLETGPQLVFVAPEPLECETDAFIVRLADGHLRLEMKDHFSTAEAAQLEVEAFLRSWEIATALQDGTAGISFVFERAEIIDRDPPPPEGGARLELQLEDAIVLADGVVVRLSQNRYPNPPAKFIASPEVIVMWDHLERYRSGRESLSTLANFCRTAFLRTEARNTISGKVISRLGYLSTKVGEPSTLRKLEDGQELRPHTPAEVAWMEAVVKRLIQRAGEWAADRQAKWQRITMEDLPNL